MSKKTDKGARDYITGELIKIGTKEHEEAVNVFAQKLVENLGYSKNQIQTIPQFRVKTSPSGEPRYPVDITVFKNEKKTYDDVLMIVECKQPNRKDGRNQLDMYLNLVPSVKFGVWFNGKEHLYLWKSKDSKTKRWIWKKIPELPKRGQRVQDIGMYKRKDLEKPKNLKILFNDIRNHLAGNITGITRDGAIAQEIINLLFCKIYAEINTPLEEQVKFRVGVDEPEEEVEKRIKNLFEQTKKENEDIFIKEDVIKLDASSIVYIVGELQKYAITQAERDAIGDAFEVFIGPALRGAEGQFFTPRNIVRMAIEMLDPQINEHIIDPACGSGGFLIVALEYVWRKFNEEAKKKGWSKELLGSKRRELSSRLIAGIDKDSFLAKITKAYMAIIGDGRGGIFCENTLVPPAEWNPKTRQKIDLGQFSVLVTNPPFGAKIPIQGERILEQYELGFKWKLNKETKQWERTNKLQDEQPPQILFIERCLQLLRENGRMAIVLPEGVFGNPTGRYIFDFIIRYAKVIGVISCPPETFQPSTHTKTSILLLEKSRGTKPYKIFMAIAEKVGHNKNGKELYKIDKKGNFILDEKGNKILADDLPVITEKFEYFKKYNNLGEYHHLGFILTSNEIKNLIFIPDYYNPDIEKELIKLKKSGKYKLVSMKELMDDRIISIKRGDEIGSKFYGTGNIPFVRSTDIVNWEIKMDPIKSVAEEVYEMYKDKQDIQPNDILFVNDGTFLIGRSAIVTELDRKIIIQSHIRKIRIEKLNLFNPFLLFYLLNTSIVKKQTEAKTFVQATISTLGNRLNEIILPVPKDTGEKERIHKKLEKIIRAKMILRRKSVEAIKL